MKQAYADKLIDNESIWIELLNARNLTSQIYDDNTASDIFEHIRSEYITELKALCEKLSS